MSAAIFNRADFEHPADGRYQLEVFGEHLNRQAGVLQVIDPKAGASIVQNFNADAAAGRLAQGHELLIDHEHFKNDPSKETVAYGWLQEMELRGDGIYGRIRWTDVGQAAVDGGEYRFFSTEYAPEDLVNLGGDPPRARPMRMDGLTLTNAPNNRGGRPITNRRGSPPSRPAQSGNPRAVQEDAARLIARLADEEQRACGGSFASCWTRVTNREPDLTVIASGRPREQSTAKLPGPKEDAAEFATQMLGQLAKDRPLGSRYHILAHIRNRFPRLTKMANREAGWDALADLEPAAHAAYLEAASNPAQYSRKIDQARADVQAQFPGLSQDQQWGKVAERYPALVSSYRREEAASDPRFKAALGSVTIEFPELGFEGRWEKMKELYPRLFWQFVLNVGSISEGKP